MQDGLAHILFDTADRHVELLRDCRIVEAVDLRQQEGLAHFRSQPCQHPVDGQQRFQQNGALFGRRLQRFGHLRQFGQIGLLQVAAPEMVDHQAARDGGQVGFRLRDLGGAGAGLQDAYESVLHEVGRAVRAMPEPRPQPAVQPATMLTIQTLDTDLHPEPSTIK